VNYNYRYRLRPSNALEEQLAWTVDTCRQVYNHFLHRLNRTDDTSAYSEQKLLPSLKKWWDDLTNVHSEVLQKVVQRLYDNLSTLRGRKENGYRVGTLKWKGQSEYRSFTYIDILPPLKGRDSPVDVRLCRFPGGNLRVHALFVGTSA
jgi:putative transposase